jgi:hypothetical protein
MCENRCHTCDWGNNPRNATAMLARRRVAHAARRGEARAYHHCLLIDCYGAVCTTTWSRSRVPASYRASRSPHLPLCSCTTGHNVIVTVIRVCPCVVTRVCRHWSHCTGYPAEVWEVPLPAAAWAVPWPYRGPGGGAAGADRKFPL